MMIAGSLWYIRQVLTRNIRANLANWIVGTTAINLSLVTYLSGPSPSLIGSAFNAASGASALLVLAAVFLVTKQDGLPVSFNPFQRKCLWFSAGITALWIFIVWGLHRTGTIPNLLTQVMLIVSYAILIERLWGADKHTESLLTWSCIFASSCVSMYTAWCKQDWLSGIYAGRSIVMCGALLFVLFRLEFKARARA